jgi:hypothetical protein
MKLVLRPLKFAAVKRDVSLSAKEEFKVAKTSKATLYACPEADALAVLLELGGAKLSFENAQGGSIEVNQVAAPGYAASLVGIARALILLRAKDPQLYEAFIEAAKLLSASTADANARITPAQLFSVSPTLKTNLKKACALFQKSPEDYFRAAGEAAARAGLRGKVAVFSPDPSEEREKFKEKGVKKVQEISVPDVSSPRAKSLYLELLRKELEAIEKKIAGEHG